MTIKNGSNTFLIGLAVYWQSCGLTCPIWTAGLMQHICAFNSYLSQHLYPNWNTKMMRKKIWSSPCTSVFCSGLFHTLIQILTFYDTTFSFLKTISFRKTAKPNLTTLWRCMKLWETCFNNFGFKGLFFWILLSFSYKNYLIQASDFFFFGHPGRERET